MQSHRLRHRDHTTLFEGEYRTLRECVEDALRQNIILDGANFAHLDLSEINLDGCALREINFSGSNLTGANISEAELVHCNFSNASLFNVCFAQSDLTGSIFTYAGFGGTDVAGAILDQCLFAGWSALTLPFQFCTSHDKAIYEIGSRRCTISTPPMVIAGLDHPVVLFDEQVLIGANLFHIKNDVWLHDTSVFPDASVLPAITSDLQKAVLTLHRVKTACAERKIVARTKSTKS